MRKERAELDRQWNAMMKEVEAGKVPSLQAIVLMEQYNRIDQELIKMGVRITD